MWPCFWGAVQICPAVWFGSASKRGGGLAWARRLAVLTVVSERRVVHAPVAMDCGSPSFLVQMPGCQRLHVKIDRNDCGDTRMLKVLA